MRRRSWERRAGTEARRVTMASKRASSAQRAEGMEEGTATGQPARMKWEEVTVHPGGKRWRSEVREEGSPVGREG